jgi:hypothetical protein
MPQTESMVYRTGDVVTWLPTGELKFLSRLDHQVKYRGYRIELDEIKISLLNVIFVKDAIVSLVSNVDDIKFLVAHIVVDESMLAADPGIDLEINKALSLSLPDYMIPSKYIYMDKLPLTANGKVDRRMLPTLDIDKPEQHGTETDISETRQRLVNIWQTLTGRLAINVDDNFLNIGGNSLLLMRFASLVNKEFTMDVDLELLFDNGSIKNLSIIIDAALENRHRIDAASTDDDLEEFLI